MQIRLIRNISIAIISLTLLFPAISYAANDHEKMGNKRMLPLQHIEPKGNPITASILIGKTVVDNHGNDVGEIEELVINRTGRITHAIVSSDGFLDIGDDLIPVPWEVFDVNREVVVTPHDAPMRLSVSKNMLMDAPRIDGPKYPVPSDVTKLDIANQYFEDEILERHNEWKKNFWKNHNDMKGSESRQG
jgi:sporulation protein YlmC with PRC-barrel domain